MDWIRECVRNLDLRVQVHHFDFHLVPSAPNFKLVYCQETCMYCQAGLEAAFQVPMQGDSGSSPDAGSISNYPGDFSLQPQGIAVLQ